MNTHRNRAPGTMARCALLATLSLAALPTAVVAADAAADQERRMRELEDRVRQEDARREMEQRARQQEEAIRSQEESIRRLEEARRRLEQNSREVLQLSSELGRNNWTYSSAAEQPRALLGVSVDNFATSKEGAVVRNVSPGGAAEAAGLKAGDIITALNGEDLAKDGNPARALVEKMRAVEPDAKVKVDLLRDGRKMSLEVTARAAPQSFAYSYRGPELEQLREQLGDLRERMRAVPTVPGTVRVEPMRGAPPAQVMSFALENGNRFSGMEFATMSDRLGDYFGVDAGVLVVRAGADAPYSLQDGDVILSIDGRTPTDAQHAGRILRSYQPGEKVKLRVQRDRKAIDLNATAPGQRN